MTAVVPDSLYDIVCTGLDGKPLPLEQFRGKPLLIVNSASLCGFSVQFKGLEAVWQKFKDQGLIVLGVPSGDFGDQELGSQREIVAMCSTKFGISFPLLAKCHVTGRKRDPLYRWLDHEVGFIGRVRWNFYKYLVGADGHVKDWFSSFTGPESQSFQRALVKLTKAS